jgi:hypothetical protein
MWPNGNLTRDRRPLVSITLQNVPLEDLVGFIAAQADLQYNFIHGTVVFSPFATEAQRGIAKAVVQKKLGSIILPKVDFQKTDIFVVLDFLNNKSKECDPDHVGVNFQAYVPDGGFSPSFTRQVTIKLEGVPLKDLLNFINMQTNLVYAITSKGVFFTEPGPEY